MNEKYDGFLVMTLELAHEGKGARLTVQSPVKGAPSPDIMEFPDPRFMFLVARKYLKDIEVTYVQSKAKMDINNILSMLAQAFPEMELVTMSTNEKRKTDA